MHRERANVAIVENWSVLRRGLAALLAAHHRVVGDTAEIADLLPAVACGDIDVLFLGPPSVADLDGWVACVQAACGREVRLVALVDDIDGHRLASILRTGVDAVLARTATDEELLDALDRVRRGERVVDQSYLPLLFSGELDAPRPRAQEDGPVVLTDRERDVLAQLAKGGTNREIASTLVVGESTVKTHLSRIYDKLEVDGRHRAVWRAIELGLLE